MKRITRSRTKRDGSVTAGTTSQLSLLDPITVDGFCGGGGWSTGFEFAIGEPVTIGINHDADAIAMHKKNHPFTHHYNENIFDVDPREACAGHHVKWAHFSPDCTHFSVAKGGKPVKKSIRGLAWVVVKWAGTVRPDIISMENVPEFLTWGPLIAKRDPETNRVIKGVEEYKDDRGKKAVKYIVADPGERIPLQQQMLVPNKKRSGETFRAFIKAMKGLGYHVEWKELVACDFGAPTKRRRLFIMFRCDGIQIKWPEATHGDPKSEAVRSGRLLPWRTAAEIIDWQLPSTSIFDREKPLAENTLRRIARGIRKFIVENPEPFIVQVNHSGGNFRGQSNCEPMPALTAKHGFGIVEPEMAPLITSIGQTGNTNRSSSVETPLPTIVSKAEHCLVTPILTKFQQNSLGQSVTEPLDTVMAGATRFACVAPWLLQYHSEGSERQVRGQTIDTPIMTVDGSPRYGMVSAFVTKYFGGGYQGAGSPAEAPIPTITAVDHNALVSAYMMREFGTTVGHAVDMPLGTVMPLDKSRLVEAFLMKYYGTGTGQTLDRPMDTVVGKDRFGLVTIHGVGYRIIDIRMRMLSPRELYAAQGFPSDYVIDVDCYGKRYPKTKQVARCGNSVPPQFAIALARANWPEKCKWNIQSMAELENRIAV